MWMLVRANALSMAGQDGAGTQVLAACPDSPERGDPWRWTIDRRNFSDRPALNVAVASDHIEVQTHQYSDGYTGSLHRTAGTQLVVAVLEGEALVTASNGPWERWLRPGDVFIAEGEEDEDLRVSLPEGNALVEVISLAPRIAHALRWVP